MTQYKKVDILDHEEEIMYEGSIFQKVEKRHFKKGEFFTMSKLISKVVLTKKYTGETFRVLFLLLDMIDFNNRIKTFTQKDLADALETSQPNISKSLKTLVEDKIIYKDGKDWYFSDDFVKFAGDKK